MKRNSSVVKDPLSLPAVPTHAVLKLPEAPTHKIPSNVRQTTRAQYVEMLNKTEQEQNRLLRESFNLGSSMMRGSTARKSEVDRKIKEAEKLKNDIQKNIHKYTDGGAVANHRSLKRRRTSRIRRTKKNKNLSLF